MSAKIILKNSAGCWLAEYIGGEEKRIRELFEGSNVLPLPFTALASPAIVKAHIQSKNPECEVIIE